MAAADLAKKRRQGISRKVLTLFTWNILVLASYDDAIKWKHFPRYWPFVRGIHRSPVNSPHKGQWRGALMFSLIYALINCWVNNREAGDLRRYHAYYDVTVMRSVKFHHTCQINPEYSDQIWMIIFTHWNWFEINLLRICLCAILKYGKMIEITTRNNAHENIINIDSDIHEPK